MEKPEIEPPMTDSPNELVITDLVVGDGAEVLLRADLRGGVALETHEGVVAIHPAAVVGDSDESDPAALHPHLDVRGAGVEAVLDELLHDRSGPLDHFASGDLAGKGFGKESDFTHGW